MAPPFSLLHTLDYGLSDTWYNISLIFFLYMYSYLDDPEQFKYRLELDNMSNTRK